MARKATSGRNSDRGPAKVEPGIVSGPQPRLLSGAAKDAFLMRVVREEADVSLESRERIGRRLQDEISQLGLRRADVSVAAGAASDRAVKPHRKPPAEPSLPPSEFDPYSPNVIVVVRTRGAADALAALEAIGSVANLRVLAREQQLGIDSTLKSAADIRRAIVAAAERRIANRRAAAS